ncbi:MAG: helix-turn-helix domain-containing protein [Lentisphaeria bacterium]|nr:helix-turn-helix domain-containing protein [Lentisphaeria bacterium]MBQ9789406.1 helix-turn-helix domain-containing protein [Lentisphaeria bacterium]
MQKKVFTYAPITKVDDVLFNIHRHFVVENVIEHDHDNCIEITIVSEGTALHHSDGKTIHLQKGDCLVTLIDGRHSIEEPKNLELFTISCTTELDKMIGFNLNFLHGMRDLFTGRGETIIFHLNSAEFTDIWRVVNQMNKLQSNSKSGELRSSFAILLCLLAQAYSRILMTGKNQYRLEKTLDYINNHYNEEIELAKLAKLSALSESQLIRTFKKNYGITPIGYQLELRLTESQRLLRETTMSVSEISYRLGFSDSNYFSHFFRRKLGSSPAQYRRENQK